MNKLITKIVGAALGLTMAIGVGVAVASNSKEVGPVHAAGEETSTLTFSSAPTSGNSYNASQSDSAKASYTWTTDSTYISADTDGSYKSIHTGSSSKTCSYQRYVSSSFSDYLIKSVSFRAKSNGTNPSCAVTINGESVGSQSLTNSYQDLTINNTAKKQGGDLVVNFSINSAKKNIMVSWVSVVYEEVSSKTLESIAVKTAPTKTTGYFEGQYFDPTGLVITGTYSDDSTEDIAYADHSSGFTFTPSTSTALSTSNTSVTIGYGGKSTTQAISVSADVLNSVSISGNMSTTSYTTANSWDHTGLTVTGSYTGKGSVDVTSNSTFSYYKNSAMTEEVATPNDLGVGNNQTIYVKATCSGVSNASGYNQTVSVTKAPSVQSATIDLTNITNNDSHSQDATDVSITQGSVTFAWTKVSGSTAANSYIGGYNNRTQTRIYTGHTLTITASSNVLKSVSFTGATGTSNGPNKMSSWTGGTLSTYDTTTGTATVTASNNVTSLVCTPSANTYLTQAIVEFYAPDVDATGITINGQTSSSVSITPYQTTRLVASVLPLNATDRTFAWSMSPSGDDAIITIDSNGNVEPIVGKYGPTVVTATSNDGDFTATCTVTVEHVSYYQAVYYPASTSSASTSGTLPDGESHTFSCENYQTGYAQLTTNATTATLTLSGYEGQKVRAVLLKMRSNGSSGTGSLSIVAGSTTVASISSAAFSDESWNGEYTTDWVLIEPEFTQYDVQADEDIVVTVTASVNSLYLSEVRVQYEPSEVDTSAVDFAQLILDDITCNAQGTSAPSSSDWLVLKGFWDDGTTVTAAGKQTLLDAEAVEHVSPSTDEEIIQAAMAKYDYIIGKYNKGQGLTTQYPDFINRNPSPIGNSKAILGFVNNDSTNTVSIIVIISMISVTCICGYFYLRKKKEQ